MLRWSAVWGDISRRVKWDYGCPVCHFLTELCCFRYSAAFSSAFPPISPIRIMPSVLGSCRNTSRQSMKFVPLNGSPPIPCRRQSKHLIMIMHLNEDHMAVQASSNKQPLEASFTSTTSDNHYQDNLGMLCPDCFTPQQLILTDLISL